MARTKVTPLTERRRSSERREIITELIVRLGYDNLNKTQLARQFKVARQTIYEDLAKIMSAIPKEALDREKSKAFFDFVGIDQRLGKIMEAAKDDPELQLQAIHIKTKAWERKAKVFEAFGLKEKVPDVVEVETREKVLTVQDFQIAYKNAKARMPEPPSGD